MTTMQKNYFMQVRRRTTSQKRKAVRAEIFILYDENTPKKHIARTMALTIKTVRKWTKRWEQISKQLNEIEQNLHQAENPAKALKDYKQKLDDAMEDAQRPGAPTTFTAEEVVQVIALACELLEAGDDNAVSHRTQNEIAQEVIRRQIVKGISQATVCRLLKNTDYQAA